MQSNQRNERGYKDSPNCYRTFGGERFVCITAGDAFRYSVEKLRAAGIRVRRIGEELFVHHADAERACMVCNERETQTAIARHKNGLVSSAATWDSSIVSGLRLRHRASG